MNFERSGIKKFNNVLFISCIAGGILGWFVAEKIYKFLPASMPTVIQVGIYVAFVMTGIAMLAFVPELIVNRLKTSWTGSEILRSILLMIVSIAILGLLGIIFQFIYGLGYSKKQVSQIDDYIFVIDNSGSTDDSDPGNLRFSEVESLLRKLDSSNRFAVEIFDHEIKGKLSLNQVNEAAIREFMDLTGSLENVEKGGTEIQLVLSDVVDTYTQDGRNAAVILLSDGESMSPVDYKYLGDCFVEKNLPIYCVAFSYMGRNGMKTMTKLAENTDGYYCEIDDLSDLQSTINNMIELSSKRSLLERRRGRDNNNILSMILRILFISTLGVLVEIALALIMDYEDLLREALLIHIVFSILAGFTAEFVMRLFSNSSITRLLMCVLMSVVVVSYTEYSYFLNNVSSMDDWEDIPGLEAISPKTNSDLKKKKRNRSHGNDTFL